MVTVVRGALPSFEPCLRLWVCKPHACRQVRTERAGTRACDFPGHANHMSLPRQPVQRPVTDSQSVFWCFAKGGSPTRLVKFCC